MTTLCCTLALVLAAAPVAPEGPAALPAAPAPGRDGAPWITAGLAVTWVAALGVGVLAAGLALGREAAVARDDEVRRLNAEPRWPTAGEQARLDLWRSQGEHANAIAIAGGVLVGVGALVGGSLLARGLVLRRRARLGPGPGAGLRLQLSF